MRWHTSLLLFSALGYLTLTQALLPSLQLPQNYIEEVPLDEDSNIEDDIPSNLGYDDDKLEKIGNILTKILILPWPKGISPLLYVENNPEEEDELVNAPEVDEPHAVPLKRSRYYRKYPWKRQNSRYQPGNRFLCTPSKEDVYRLLVALHEARQGNRDRVVNFCNRKRPAASIFTNIRFLGK